MIHGKLGLRIKVMVRVGILGCRVVKLIIDKLVFVCFQGQTQSQGLVIQDEIVGDAADLMEIGQWPILFFLHEVALVLYLF